MCGVQTYYNSPPNDQESQMLIFVNIDSEVWNSPLQECHEEAKTDEDHNMNILEHWKEKHQQEI